MAPWCWVHLPSSVGSAIQNVRQNWYQIGAAYDSGWSSRLHSSYGQVLPKQIRPRAVWSSRNVGRGNGVYVWDQLGNSLVAIAQSSRHAEACPVRGEQISEQ